MVQYPHAVQVSGKYQLVALTYSPVYSPGDVFGYAVFTSEGARVTEVLSLEQARSQWALLCDQDGGTRVQDEIEPRTTPRRRRRKQ
ncbi:hypothetical protein [Stenotrophomonas rhizophila]|uniref:hypothetical protein n=1 Tax=Stenotrophomonas rhizophila TaxID=216778 RepID=UPI001E341591|nr:hypothetical protein [Stenotrophomonas rhizophila]MCC7634837.1 hypothetical protein [Stenotrophomonas rhizophila]MCC7664490.1 hypothetical protein [Stenotrophomonas rhizophila]